MSRKIKILFTIPNFDTAGSGKVVYDLVKGLDNTIFAPEICCFHDKGAYFEVIRTLGIPIHLFEFSKPYKPLLTLPFRIYKIARFFKTHQFDLIHSWHWSSDFTEPLAAKFAGIPFVYTKKAMGWGNRAWTWRSKLSTKIIAINTDMTDLFFSDLKDKVIYIPLGVDADYFKPQQKSIELQTELGIETSDFVVITVANLVPVKGIEILLEAVLQLNDPLIKLLIIGRDTDTYGENLKNKYQSKRTIFLAAKVDIRPYLALANLFVIPTLNKGRKEGLPVAPLEAMASECYVLGSNISGIRDILKDFKNHLFEQESVDALVQKMNHVKHLNEKQRRDIGIKMRQYVIEHYSIEKCIRNHENIYLRLLKNR